MSLTITDLPYRKWGKAKGKPALCETANYRKIMKHVDQAMKAGKAVTMVHRIVGLDWVNSRRGDVYDVLDITIGD